MRALAEGTAVSFDAAELERMMRARILIVEDEGIVAKDLQKNLESLGYEVCGTSASGPDAIGRAEALRPDLILMDVRLRGDMDGIETARRIRTQLDVPVVFLTAYADSATVARAADVGPFGYVLKPFDDRELQVTLIMAMCKHRAFAELDRRVHERTAALARTEAKYERLQSVVELGLFALGSPDMEAVMQRAVSLVAKSLDIEFVNVLELQPDGGTLVLRAGVGWRAGEVGRALVSGDASSHAGYTLDRSEPVVMADRDSETRFQVSALLREHDAAGGISVVIHAPGPMSRPYGVLGAYARERRPYTESDVHFLQAVANVVATAIMRATADAKVVEAERIAQEQLVRTSMAEEALRAREEFLSVAAHELRTPVAALQLQMQALSELVKQHEAPLDPRFLEKSARAVATVARLASLVESMLDVSGIALGNLQLEKEWFDLAGLVRQVAARHEDLAARAGCVLRVDVSDSVRGCWDRVRLEQVLTNLLSNALKFGAGKPIDLSLEPAGTTATLIVRDRGQGIEPADAERIVRRFERAVSHQHYGGLGLGLYIAAQIVKAHDGELGVSSVPGQGATFTVALPRDTGAGSAE